MSANGLRYVAFFDLSSLARMNVNPKPQTVRYLVGFSFLGGSFLNDLPVQDSYTRDPANVCDLSISTVSSLPLTKGLTAWG